MTALQLTGPSSRLRQAPNPRIGYFSFRVTAVAEVT
jgi:hypothetical protein